MPADRAFQDQKFHEAWREVKHENKRPTRRR
jgi:hypothetical protein